MQVRQLLCHPIFLETRDVLHLSELDSLALLSVVGAPVPHWLHMSISDAEVELFATPLWTAIFSSTTWYL